jgi:hypothetical protein
MGLYCGVEMARRMLGAAGRGMQQQRQPRRLQQQPMSGGCRQRASGSSCMGSDPGLEWLNSTAQSGW